MNKLNEKIEKILLGFASGVMVSASVWSLLIPSIDMAKEQKIISFIPATIGFILGIIFLLILDNIIPHLHLKSSEPEGLKSKLGKSAMMVLAVTLHNVPEGMAVGVALAGAIISMPLKEEGNSKTKSFIYGTLSGVVEPIFGGITILLTSLVVPVLPYLLSFAAGAMIYVVVEELIPESQIGKHSNLGTLGFALGFVIMMILDVSLG